MVGEGDRRRKKCLKGRFFDRFGSGTFVAGIQVFIEECPKVDFVERVLVGFLIGDDFGFWRGGCRGWFGGSFDGRKRRAVVVESCVRFGAVGGYAGLGGPSSN
jgi:hypothetical protein